MSLELAHIPKYPVREVIIDPSGDLTIRVEELNHMPKSHPNQPMLQVTFIRVSAEKVLATSSQHFAQLLDAPTGAGRASACALEDVNCIAAEIVLRALHHPPLDWVCELSSDEWFEVAHICQKYGIDCKLLSAWFAYWYDNSEYNAYESDEYLFLCYFFDHAEGFRIATWVLAYGCFGDLEPYNPTMHEELCVCPRIIGAINSARRELFDKLIEAIVTDMIDPLMFSDECKQRHMTIGLYVQALSAVDICPPYKYRSHTSVDTMLSNLVRFRFEVQHVDCLWCDRDFKRIVEGARAKIEKHFTGMCLDCMRKPKTGSRQDGYDEQSMQKRWDSGCRIKHGEPTWLRFLVGSTGSNSIWWEEAERPDHAQNQCTEGARVQSSEEKKEEKQEEKDI